MSTDTTNTKPRFVHGVIAPLLTPIRSDRTIDDEAIPGLIRYLAETRAVNAVFARSGIGQIHTFSVEETKRFAVRVRDAIGDRMGLMLGCPGEWLGRRIGTRPDPSRYMAQSVELTQYAGHIGAEAAVHPIPVALKPRGEELVSDLVFRYYQTMNEATTIPILIYQTPDTPTDYRLTPELIKRLLTLSHIAGAKVSSARDITMQPLLAAAIGTRFGVICGNEAYLLRGLQQGATGVIGIGTMVMPEVYRTLIRRYRDHDVAGAQAASDDVLQMLRRMGRLDQRMVAKQYLRRKGLRLETYARPEPDLYGREPVEPYPPDVVGPICALFDELRSKYRS